MMKHYLPYMTRVDERKEKIISSFCAYVGRNKNNLTEKDKKFASEFIISLVTGCSITDINPGIYSKLSSYLEENITTIDFKYLNNYIKEIIVGSISCGPVFCKDFSDEDLKERNLLGKSCCGVISSFENKKRLFINYNGKTVFSDDIKRKESDCKNVHIGDYYFNIYDILKSNSKPFMMKLTVPYLNQLQEDVLIFDNDGNLVNTEIYVNYLESFDNEGYKVVKQVHNELENIDDCHNGKFKK